MAYFPFFTDISNKKGLIVGGGTVAQRKIEKLLPFGPAITVIAPDFTQEIKEMAARPGQPATPEAAPTMVAAPATQVAAPVQLVARPYTPGDEAGFTFVIAATNNREVNSLISRRCQEQNIPVNVVDDPELCSFIFPSIVKEGKLTVGISTSGISPTAAIELKNRIRNIIPPTFDEILDYLYNEREIIKQTVKTESERHAILNQLFNETMIKQRPLTEKETEEIINSSPLR